MEKASIQRLTKVLNIMVTVLIVCNVIALLFVPSVVVLSPHDLAQGVEERVFHLLRICPLGEDDIYVPMLWVALTAWGEMWENTAWILHSLFLLVCGSCSLVILGQARNILGAILEEKPFQRTNARSMKRAAVCCWIISGAALVRLAVELWYHGNTAPLYTYNTLAVPVLFMAGLLFLVMSALFRQAAELKEDQDLTI